MDDFELIFSMLSERATTEIHRTENSKASQIKNRRQGRGDIAGGARKQLEKRIAEALSPETTSKSGKQKLKKRTIYVATLSRS